MITSLEDTALGFDIPAPVGPRQDSPSVLLLAHTCTAGRPEAVGRPTRRHTPGPSISPPEAEGGGKVGGLVSRAMVHSGWPFPHPLHPASSQLFWALGGHESTSGRCSELLRERVRPNVG